MVVVLFVALAAMPVAAQDANPLNPQNILNIPVINKQRVSINETTAPGTYFFDIGNNLTNGGQNAVHVTDTNATPNGIFHNSSILNPSDVDMLNGSFYISDTGGKGYEDEAILLIAASDVDPDTFSIHIKSEGYKFTDHAPNSPPIYPNQTGTFNPDAYENTFHLSDAINGNSDGANPPDAALQNWKWSTSSSDNVNEKLFYEENLGSEDDYNMILADLNTSIVGTAAPTGGGNASYRNLLTYNGNPKITYNITGLGDTGRVAFIPYAYVAYQTGGGSYFNETVGWTDRASGDYWVVNATPLV